MQEESQVEKKVRKPRVKKASYWAMKKIVSVGELDGPAVVEKIEAGYIFELVAVGSSVKNLNQKILYAAGEGSETPILGEIRLMTNRGARMVTKQTIINTEVVK